MANISYQHEVVVVMIVPCFLNIGYYKPFGPFGLLLLTSVLGSCIYTLCSNEMKIRGLSVIFRKRHDGFGYFFNENIDVLSSHFLLLRCCNNQKER